MRNFQGLHVVSKNCTDTGRPRPPTLVTADSPVRSSNLTSNIRAIFRDEKTQAGLALTVGYLLPLVLL
jgi:hypothetical protein